MASTDTAVRTLPSCAVVPQQTKLVDIGDKAALWNSGTKRNVEPAMLEHIGFKLQKGTVDGSPRKCPRPRFVPMTQEEIKKMHEEPPYAELFTLPGTILYESLHAPDRQLKTPPLPVKTTHGDHTDNSCTQCNQFYDKYVALSPLAASALELETVSPATSLWQFSRKLRLTASNISKVHTVQPVLRQVRGFIASRSQCSGA
ncbi:uncharacterized protein LOC144107744 [Amblyomma americanum]